MSVIQFFQRFPSEAATRQFVEEAVWGGEPICPAYGSRRQDAWSAQPGHYRCKDCRKIYSVKGNCAIDTIDRMNAVYQNAARKHLKYEELIA